MSYSSNGGYTERVVYNVMYKMNNVSSWLTAYSGDSENTAFYIAEQKRDEGLFAVKIVDQNGRMIG